MTNHEPKPAVILAAVLASEEGTGTSAYRDAIAAEALIRLGKRAARIALNRCNGIPRYDAAWQRLMATWTEDDELRAEKDCKEIANSAAAILKPYGATDISVGGDPRGFTLKWRFASGRSNSFGGEVWGV